MYVKVLSHIKTEMNGEVNIDGLNSGHRQLYSIPQQNDIDLSSNYVHENISRQIKQSLPLPNHMLCEFHTEIK